jgi:hypothetical protein
MPRLHPARRLACLTLVLLLVACDEGENGTPLEPPPPRPIAEGTWYMHAANGQLLPTRISDRFIGVTQEEIFVDSAQLSVDYVTGTYRQRAWTRVNHTGVEDRREFIFDEGTFAQEPSGFTFSSTTRARTVTIAVPDATKLESTETLAFHAGAATLTGTYRQLRP